MHIVVLGSTGPTGQQMVSTALDAGHRVTAVARQPEALTIQSPQLILARADVFKPQTIEGVFAGADAILSALGSHTGRKPTSIYSVGTRKVCAEMHAAGVRRLVCISAIPVQDPHEKSFVDRYIAHPILGLFFGGAYADLRIMEADLRATTDLDWTVVRPPRLLDGPATGDYRSIIGSPLPGARDIRRADLAAAMLALVTDQATFQHVVTIGR